MCHRRIQVMVHVFETISRSHYNPHSSIPVKMLKFSNCESHMEVRKTGSNSYVYFVVEPKYSKFACTDSYHGDARRSSHLERIQIPSSEWKVHFLHNNPVDWRSSCDSLVTMFLSVPWQNQVTCIRIDIVIISTFCLLFSRCLCILECTNSCMRRLTVRHVSYMG